MDIKVHPYTWTVEDRTENDHVEIRAWCLDVDSNPYLLRFTDFPSLCHVELPICISRRNFNWTRESANLYIETLANRLDVDYRPIRTIFKMSKPIYYYQGEKNSPFVLLGFRTINAMWKFKNLLEKCSNIPDIGWVPPCKVWEERISIVRKLLTFRECRYSQWFSITGNKVDEEIKISTLEREYFVQWKSLNPIPSSETKSWVTHPRIVSFDIEAYAEKHNAMPKELNAKDVAYSISVIYQQLSIPESRKKYIIVYGDCYDIEGVEVIRTSTELEMINEFSKLINRLDPEILMGYNIFSFDYPYLDARVKRRMEQWLPMGRIRDKPTKMIDPIKWESGAYGHQYIQYLEMDGRISVDLLPLVRREYKLDKYSLDFVANHFLGIGKNDVSPQEMFRIYEKMQNAFAMNKEYQMRENPMREDQSDKKSRVDLAMNEAKREMTRVMEYCVQDSELVIDLFVKLNSWIGLIELSNIVGVTIMELYTHGQQVRCLSQIYDLATTKGYVITSREQVGIKFSGGFVFEPLPGLYENVLCFDFASLYPSIIQAYNICYTTLVPSEMESKIPDEHCNIFDFYQDEIEDPDGDDFDMEVEEEDLKNEKKGKEKNEKDEKDEKDETLKNLNNDPIKKGKKRVHHRYKFIKAEYRAGLLPELVRNLVNERKAVRRVLEGVRNEETGEWIIEKEKDPITKIVLNSRQLALKVTANSFFGFLGVQRGGKLPLIEAAMSITAKGRELIGMVNKYLEDKYHAKVVYNDTDSSMVDLGITDTKKCPQMGKELAIEISNLFPPPLRMEFEKAMRLLCIRKKKYAAVMINNKGEYDYGKILKKGIVLARRDNCKWIRRVYENILMCILYKKEFNEAIDLVVTSIQELLSGKVSPRDLVVIKGLNSNYKSPTFCMKIFAEELRKKGQIVNAGDRLEYIILDKSSDPNIKYMGERMQLPEMYQASQETDNPDKIDYLYYLEHAMKNCIDQLISVGFNKVLPSYENVGYKPQGRKKFRSIANPVEMIITMIKDRKEFVDNLPEELRKIKSMTTPRYILTKSIDGRPKLIEKHIYLTYNKNVSEKNVSEKNEDKNRKKSPTSVVLD